MTLYEYGVEINHDINHRFVTDWQALSRWFQNGITLDCCLQNYGGVLLFVYWPFWSSSWWTSFSGGSGSWLPWTGSWPPNFRGGGRFLATLDRFLTPPNFRGCQVPGYPGQVPGTPEKQNLTKNLETGLKLNISKKFFQNLLIYNKLEFWEACSNLYLQKKRFRGARNLSPLGFLVLINVSL